MRTMVACLLLSGCALPKENEIDVSHGWLGTRPVVRLNFEAEGEPVEVVMDPDQAIEFGEALIRHAKEAKILPIPTGTRN